MSSAAARAEARKKAILARGSDRLSRLTSSARGEGEAAERFTPEPPARTSNFLGEDSPSPSTPPRPTTVPRQPSASPSSRPVSVSGSSPFSSPFSGPGSGADTVPPFNPSAQPDPSVWSADQQQQFMRALMGASLRGGAGGPSDAPESAGALPSPIPNPANGSIPPGADDPFGAMLAALAQQGQSQGQGGMPGMPQMPMGMPPMPGMEQMQETMSPPSPPTLFKRLLPLVHVLGAWVLLAFFVGWKEPAILGTQGRGSTAVEGFWHRWAGLVHGPARDGWGVQAAPFFWAFITLEIMLFSLRIFTGVDRRAPHMLLAMALPHLPPPLPSLITYGLKYIQMAGVLLDDLAALLVALGAIVWVSGFFGS